MADLRNKYGEVVYRIEGDRINDIYGNWKYEIRGEYIFDTYGNRTYEIKGEYLFDNYGNRLGEMKNLADLLPSPKDSSNSSSHSGDTHSSSEKPGCLGMILAFFVKIFIKSSIGGKIGGIAGVVIMIVSTIVGGLPIGNLIFFIPMMLLVGIGIGTFIGFILRKSSRTGKFGALIGAGGLGLIGGILSLLGSKPNVSDFFMLAIVGIVIGFFLGIAIGAIVNLIQEKRRNG